MDVAQYKQCIILYDNFKLQYGRVHVDLMLKFCGLIVMIIMFGLSQLILYNCI